MLGSRAPDPPPCTPCIPHLLEVVAEALVAFEGRPAGEIACPELVGAVGIGEEVVGFHGPVSQGCQGHPGVSQPTRDALPRPPSYLPGEVGLVQLLEVAGRRGVEDIHMAAVGLLLGDRGAVSPDKLQIWGYTGARHTPTHTFTQPAFTSLSVDWFGLLVLWGGGQG